MERKTSRRETRNLRFNSMFDKITKNRLKFVGILAKVRIKYITILANLLKIKLLPVKLDI